MDARRGVPPGRFGGWRDVSVSDFQTICGWWRPHKRAARKGFARMEKNG